MALAIPSKQQMIYANANPVSPRSIAAPPHVTTRHDFA